MLTGYEQPA
jgi:hypothetical protein